MAELTHLYASQTTRSDDTDTTWAVPTNGCSISGASLSASTKYLIIARAKMSGSSGNGNYYIRVSTADDTNIASLSEQMYEPALNNQPTRGNDYLFVRSYTTDASPATIQFEQQGSTGTTYTDQMSLTLIDLDDLGSSNYIEASFDTDTSLATGAGTELANISTLAASTEYLFLGYARLQVDGTTTSHGVSLQDGTTRKTRVYAEGEDLSERRVYGVMGAWTTAATPLTAAIYGDGEASTSADADGSYLIAIKTDAFEDFTYDYSATGGSVGTTEGTLRTLSSYTPTTSGNHLVFGRYNITNAGILAAAVNVAGTSSLAGDIDTSVAVQWDGTDRGQNNIVSRVSISAASDITLRAKAVATETAEYEFVAVLNLNLAGNTDRQAQVSWVELEIPTAPRQGMISWVELEVPNAARQAQVSWLEMELENAGRQAQLSWLELEVPTAPRQAQVSWLELELENAARQAQISWLELEAPNAARQAQVSWLELETTDAGRKARVSWLELETPGAPRQAQISWIEFEVPENAGRQAMVSWVELEVPDAGRQAQVSWVEMELTDAGRQAQLSWLELEMPTAPRQAQVSWVELELTDAARQAQVSWVELELENAARQAQLSWLEMELTDAGRQAQLSWLELEVPTAPRQAQVSWLELEIPIRSRQAQVSWFELEIPSANQRTAQLSWLELETPDAARQSQVSWIELEMGDGPRRAQVSWAEMEIPAAARKAQVSWSEFEIPAGRRQAQVSWLELEVPDNIQRTAQVSWLEFEMGDALRKAQISWLELQIPNVPVPGDDRRQRPMLNVGE